MNAWCVYAVKQESGTIPNTNTSTAADLHTLYQTAGAELTTNFHPFSLPIPLDMGLRYTYRFDEGDTRLEAVANMVGF